MTKSQAEEIRETLDKLAEAQRLNEIDWEKLRYATKKAFGSGKARSQLEVLQIRDGLFKAFKAWEHAGAFEEEGRPINWGNFKGFLSQVEDQENVSLENIQAFDVAKDEFLAAHKTEKDNTPLSDAKIKDLLRELARRYLKNQIRQSRQLGAGLQMSDAEIEDALAKLKPEQLKAVSDRVKEFQGG
jgi:hypothetical protein